MKTKPSLGLMVTMLMFPQIVETIYSPVLGSIAQHFFVTDAQVAQTLSIYFIAFAIGVVAWGVFADKYGRRPAMLCGLIIYAVACTIALLADNFATIMLARALSAFGIAVGSVVTQTMLRDAYSGEELSKVFSLMGMGIAISPVVGMLLGGQLAHLGGHQAVFFTLLVMAMLLLLFNTVKLPETQHEKRPLELKALAKKMLTDVKVWQSAILVSVYNIALFSYYQLGGFAFSDLGLTADQFGYSGVVLGIGTLLGSALNRYLLSSRLLTSPLLSSSQGQTRLLGLSAILLMTGGVGVNFTLTSIYFLLPMMMVVMAFGIAIPNILSIALVDYKAQAGSAGALFGLSYYLMIGVGLALAGFVQHLGTVLIGCGVITIVIMVSTHKNERHS
ncbi:multidrug effflux MFS transporter [Vibrio cionasavignyae]|uniref:multidrug effflux MFS transporter n=1 Tax=Vibrio cionasavignyae TaxID=2910252 RepID=UPI003D14B33C